MALPRHHPEDIEDQSEISREGANGTSQLSSNNGLTQKDSLPDLSSAGSSGPPKSFSDGEGERRLNRSLRIMVTDPEGALEPSTLPPLRRRDQVPVLECPFAFIKCFRQFGVSNEREWIQHSLDHFRLDGKRSRMVDPPKINACCFCPDTFEASSGIASWRDRMDHVRIHHLYLDHRVATARHDFALVERLWHNGLLSPAEYRDLNPSTRAAVKSPQSLNPMDSDDQSKTIRRVPYTGSEYLKEMGIGIPQQPILSTLDAATTELPPLRRPEVSDGSHRGTVSNPSNPAIASYLQDHQGPRMPRIMAQRSALPHSQEHQTSNYHGPPLSDIGSSRLPAGSDFTQNDSLHGLTRASEKTVAKGGDFFESDTHQRSDTGIVSDSNKIARAR